MIESEAIEEFAQLLHRHVCPSVQIGCGKSRATASLKFHAVTHALRLLSPSLPYLDRLFKSISVFLSDQGTESVFSRLSPDTPLLGLVPASQPLQTETADVAEVDFAPELEAPQQMLEVDFCDAPPAPDPPANVAIEDLPEDQCVVDVTGSLEVDDLLHCIHNATKGLAAAMKSFDDVVGQCKKVADLLRKKESKDRLIETCFSQGLAKGFASEVKQFKSHVHEDRWGTVAECIPNLLRLKAALRYGWDFRAFRGYDPAVVQDAAEAQNDEEEFGARVSAVNAAIESEFFWAFLCGVEQIAKALEQCIAWAESCSCHWRRDRAEASDEEKALWRICPLRCRRCADMAAGEFLQQVHDSLDASSSRIALDLPSTLSADERMSILTDFEAARNHILYYFHLKLQYWQEPPWCLFGMAHKSGEIALQCEAKARSSSCAHPRVQRIRQEPLQSQIQVWRSRGGTFGPEHEPDDLPELRAFLCELRLASLNSRYVEAEHAKVQVGLRKAPRHSDAYVSLLRRMPGLTKEMKANPHILPLLADKLQQVRHGKDAVQVLGLSGHSAFSSTQHPRDPLSWKIVYHSDPYTKFTMPAPDLVFGGNQPPGQGRSVRELLDAEQLGDAAALHHSLMIQHLCKYPAEAGSVFSMEFEASAFQSLTAVMQGSLPSAAPALEDTAKDAAVELLSSRLESLDLLSHTAPNMTQKSANMVFWKIVNISASKVKRPKLDEELSLSDSLLVALHRLLDIDMSKKTLLVSLDADNRTSQNGSLPPMLFCPTVLSSPALKTLKVWRSDNKEEFRLQDEAFSAVERALLPGFLQRCVSQNDDETVSRKLAQSGLIEKLTEQGLVEGPPFRLTQAGKNALVVGQRLHSFENVFRVPQQVPEDPVECIQMSTYHLVKLLEASGFQHELVDVAGAKQAKHNPYRCLQEGQAARSKVWYTRRGSLGVSAWYLVALLFAEQHGKDVPHFAKQAECQSLVDPNFVPPRKRTRHKMLYDSEKGFLSDWPEDAIVVAPRPKRRKRQQQIKESIEDAGHGLQHMLEDARQHAVEDAPQASNSATAVGDAAPAPASPPASSSSSSSSTDSSTSGSDDDSNSSSSSSSSSSGSGCAASVDAARGPDAPDEREPRRRTADRVVEWGILRLTPKVAADGTTFAWQMTCRHPGHVPCNRTRNVASCASEDECLRMLKQWALFGVECTSKGDHKLAWSRVEAMSKDGSLPSTAALDVQAITDIALYR